MKVFIGGGLVSVNVFVVSKFVFLIFKKNICVLVCFVENRFKGFLVKKLNVNIAGIKDVIFWGNIGVFIIVDFRNVRVYGFDGVIWGLYIFGFIWYVLEMVYDDKWLVGEFLEILKKFMNIVKSLKGIFFLLGSFVVLI